MKAITGSCSKAIVERLGASSPKSIIHVSDRPELCFSPRCRNDKVGNFRLLQLVQRKGIHPVHAVPSKTQVDVETVEPEAQQTMESKMVSVKFQLQKDCMFGEQFFIVGDDPMFGAWDPSNALPMTWSDNHIWTLELDIPVGKSIQFKVILKAKSGDTVWQPGPDRIIHTWETLNRITVCEDWENAELQKIIEEEQLAHSNEEPQIDSEMSSFTENLGHPIDGQNHAEEKPLAEPDLQEIIGDSISSSMEKPLAIVAENIGSSDNLENKSHVKTTKNLTLKNEESAVSPRNDGIIHELEHNGNAAPVKNQEMTIRNEDLFGFEGGPVLVPGLTPSVVPTEEAAPNKVDKKVTMDTSFGAFEIKDQNMPEFTEEQESDDSTSQEISATINSKEQESDDNTSQDITATINDKEQESDDSTAQEMSATINNEPELLENEYEQKSHSATTMEDISEKSHLATTMEEMSDSQPVDGNLLKNDVIWGRETLMKFLTKLRLV